MKKNLGRWAALIACVSLTAQVSHVGAATILDFGDNHELGFVFAGIPAGDANVTSYVNQLVGMNLNTSSSVGGNSFTRSGNFFSLLDPAVLVLPRGTYSSFADVKTDPSTLILDLNGGYEYLLAKYDGPNSGTEVWYVGNLTGSVTIPTFNGQYGISGSSFFTPGNSTNVPDFGPTAALLGFVFLGVESLRRRTLTR